MFRFQDRADAGRRLAAVMRTRAFESPVVLGIPRGGVPVAAEVAAAIRAPLGVITARKLGAPGQPELAIGAVAADGSYYLDSRLAALVGADDAYVARERERQATDATRRDAALDGHRRPPLQGRTVIIVDDGIATGATAIAAARSAKAQGAARTVIAAPVVARTTAGVLRHEADEVVCVRQPEDMGAVGYFYEDFRATPEDSVRLILEESASRRGEPAIHVTLERDGLRLAVDLWRPPGTGRAPVVVFVHGLGSSKDSPRNLRVASKLLGAGIAAVLFDLSSHGESDPDPGGEAAFEDDLAAVYAWVSAQPDLGPVGIAGSSLGGIVALRAVKAGRLQPASLALRSPPLHPADIDGLSVPTLLLVGANDPLAGLLERVALPEAVSLEVIAGAGHRFEEPGVLDSAATLAANWFAANLRPSP